MERQISATACSSRGDAGVEFTAMLLQYIEKFFILLEYCLGNLRSLWTII